MSKRIFFGFSLVEILVALIAVSCIMSALAPVITKKLKSNAVTVGSMSGKMEFSAECSTWGDDCIFCTEDRCSLCTKDCNNWEFIFTQDCTCKNCTEVTSNCIQCSAKKCKKCNGGYGLVNDNCEQCSAGTYSDGTTACLQAPAGSYVANAGASTYTPCGIGTYQNETGKTSCKTCPSGKYQNETGKTSCKTCEIDYMCTGGNNKTQCAANYGANAGSSSCSPCSSYCSDCQVPSVCLKCNNGFYLNNNTCYPCTVGYSCNGTATQSACSAGYYAGAGASSCSKCAAGTYSSAGASSCTNCSAGKYSGAGASSCTNCSAGTYSNAGASSCSQCSAGYYSSAGASSCSACSSGYYSSAGASGCTACSSTWEHCTACSASGCSTCESGYQLSSSGGCEPGVGPPRNQADCDKYNALFIPSSYTGFYNVCMMKYNTYDNVATTPADSSGITLTDAATYCSGACCWQGNTTEWNWDGSCNASYQAYSGCTRIVCNQAAANAICAKLNPAGFWRLPTQSEISNIIYYINAGSISASSLQLCSLYNMHHDSTTNGSIWGINNCPAGYGHYGKWMCNKTEGHGCYPSSIAIDSGSVMQWTTGPSIGTLDTGYGRSVRCVAQEVYYQ